jgi:ribosomal protein S18 acetylase RimI-like enzyme
MSAPDEVRIRPATPADSAQLVRLWALVFDQDEGAHALTWTPHALEWFARAVEDRHLARFPLIEIEGTVVATASGTLELGVPNPHCPQGRTVRLANLVTLPEHRRSGYGTPCSRRDRGPFD